MKYVLIYLICINLVAFSLFGIDKQRAVNGEWRISEKTLMVSAAAGGSAGALIGMKVFHHKTLKKKFSVGIPVILVVQLIFASYYLFGRMK